MLKKYQSKSCISLSVLMENGKSVRVSFDSLTGGGSVFYTKDEELQAALEKHAKFGKLFSLVQEVADEKKPAKKAKTVKAPVVTENTGTEDGEKGDEKDTNTEETNDTNTEETNDTNTEDNGEADDTEDDEEGDSLKEIHVTDIEDAKDYLAENFGISRTKLRGSKAFTDIAASKGIKFVIASE